MTVTHTTTAPTGQDTSAAKPEVVPEPTAAAEPANPEPKPTKPRGTKKPASKARRSARTLSDLAEGYIGSLEAGGKSHGTIFSYGMEMKLALSELGATTKLSALTVKRVEGFYECDRVMKLKSGKPKSILSIAKSRRVLRLALVWAVDQKWIEKAPLPAGTKVVAKAAK